MLLDEHAQRRARQDLLEAVLSGMAGPAIAPMPGIMLEMLEIAATERRATDFAPSPEPCATALLTSATNGSRMRAPSLLGKVIDVAGRLAAGLVARRLSA